MNSKVIATAILAVVIAAGSIVLAQQPSTPAKPVTDPRLDKIIEQNTQIIKSQQDIEKKMDELKEGLLQIRRRSS